MNSRVSLTAAAAGRFAVACAMAKTLEKKRVGHENREHRHHRTAQRAGNPRGSTAESQPVGILLKIVKVAGRCWRREVAWRRRRRECMKAAQGGKWLVLAALWLPAGCALPKQAKL